MTDTTAAAKASDRKISIISYTDILPTDSKKAGTIPDKTLSKVGDALKAIKSIGVRNQVSASDLKNNLKNFLDAMHDTLDGIPNALAGYHLEEMEIEVEVSAEREVSLLGTGGKVGGKGSLTLKLKRDDGVRTVPAPTT